MVFFWKKNRNLEASEEAAEPKKKKRGLFTGLIVGGAVGSVVSILFAPDKGENTRARISKKSGELFDEGKSKAEEFLDKYRK